MPRELVGVERLGISSVVLIEVGETVVEENWCLQFVGNRERKRASHCWDHDVSGFVVGIIDHLPAPCWRISGKAARVLIKVHGD